MTALTILKSTFSHNGRLRLLGWGMVVAWTLVTAAAGMIWASHGIAVGGYAILWLLGLGGIAYGARRMDAQFAKRDRVTARIRFLANYDTLTKLPNRHQFLAELKRILEETNGRGTRTALLMIDVASFKVINELLGLDAGDQVLREVARRLTAVVRETDLVARVGCDQFAVLLADLPDVHVVARVANEILSSIAVPIRLRDEDLVIRAAMGIALSPDDAEGPKALADAADGALRDVKNLHKTGFNFAGANGVETLSRPIPEKRRASL